MRTQLLILSGAALLLASNCLAYDNGFSIGLNFAADEVNGTSTGTLTATNKAGAVPQFNWNDLRLASGSASSLNKDFGGGPVASSASVTWSCPNTWSTTGRGEENNGFPTGGDRTMMTGYLDTDNGAGVATVTVTGLGPEFTTRGYDVLVYCLGGVSGRGGAYTIGSTTLFGTAPSNPSSHVEDPGVDLTDTGTYVRFTNQHGASFTMVADANNANGPNRNFRAPVNGIQILAAPGYDFNDCLVPPGGTVTGVAKVADDGSGNNCVIHLTDASGKDSSITADGAGGFLVKDLPPCPENLTVAIFRRPRKPRRSYLDDLGL